MYSADSSDDQAEESGADQASMQAALAAPGSTQASPTGDDPALSQASPTGDDQAPSQASPTADDQESSQASSEDDDTKSSDDQALSQASDAEPGERYYRKMARRGEEWMRDMHANGFSNELENIRKRARHMTQ